MPSEVEDVVEFLYASKYTNLIAAVFVCLVIVFSDKMDFLIEKRTYWTMVFLLLLATLLIYEENPTIPFMLSALISSSGMFRFS